MLTAKQIQRLPLGLTPVPKTNLFRGRSKSKRHKLKTQSVQQRIELEGGKMKLITHEAPDNRRKDFVNWKRKSVIEKKDL